MKLFSYTSIVSSLTFLVVVSSKSQQTQNQNELSEIFTTSQNFNDFESDSVSIKINTDETNEELHISKNINDLQQIENIDTSTVTQDKSVISEKAITNKIQNDNIYSDLQISQMNIDTIQDSISSLTKENNNVLNMQSSATIDDQFNNVDSLQNANIYSVSIVEQSQNSQTIGVNTDINNDYSNTMASQSNEGLNNKEKSTKNNSNQNIGGNTPNIYSSPGGQNMMNPNSPSPQNMYSSTGYANQQQQNRYPGTSFNGENSFSPNIRSGYPYAAGGPAINSQLSDQNMKNPNSIYPPNTYNPTDDENYNPQLNYLDTDFNSGSPSLSSSDSNIDSGNPNRPTDISGNNSPLDSQNKMYPDSANFQNTYKPTDYPNSNQQYRNLGTNSNGENSFSPNLGTDYPYAASGPAINSQLGDQNMMNPNSISPPNTYNPTSDKNYNPQLNYRDTDFNSGNPSLSSSDSNIDSGNPNRPTDISGNNSPLDSQNKMYPNSANFQNTYKPTDYPNSNQQYRNLGTNSNGENSFSPNLGTDYPYAASGPAINSQLGDQNMMNPNSISPPNTYNPTSDKNYNPQLNYRDTDFNSGNTSLSSSDSNIDSGNPNRPTDISGNNSPLDSQNKMYPNSANFQNTYKPTDYPNSNQQYRNLGTNSNGENSFSPNLGTDYPYAASGPAINSQLGDQNMMNPNSISPPNTYNPTSDKNYNPQLNYLDTDFNSGNPSLSSSDSNIDSGNPNRPTDISGNNSPLDSQNKMYPNSANFQNTYKPTDYPNSNQQYRNLGTNSNGENSFSPNLGTDYPYAASGPAINSQLGDQNMMNPNSISPPNTYNPTSDKNYNPQFNYLDNDFNSGNPSLSSSDSNIDSGNPNRPTDISGNNSPLDSQNKMYPDSANFQNTYKPTDYPNSNQQYRNLGTNSNGENSFSPNLGTDYPYAASGPAINSQLGDQNMMNPNSIYPPNKYNPTDDENYNPQLNYRDTDFNSGNPSLSSSDSNIDSGNPNRPTDISGNNSPLDSQNKMYPNSANFQNTYKPTDYPNSNQQYRNIGTNSNGENSFSPNLGTGYPYAAGGPAINSQLGDQNMMNPNSPSPQNMYSSTCYANQQQQNRYPGTSFNGENSFSPNIRSGYPYHADSPLDSQNTLYPDSANSQKTYKPTDYPNSNQQYRNLGTNSNGENSFSPNLGTGYPYAAGGPAINSQLSDQNMKNPNSIYPPNTYNPTDDENYNPQLNYLDTDFNSGNPSLSSSDSNIDSGNPNRPTDISGNNSPLDSQNKMYPDSANFQNTYKPTDYPNSNQQYRNLGTNSNGENSFSPNLGTDYPYAASGPAINSQLGDQNMMNPNSISPPNTYNPTSDKIYNPQLNYLDTDFNSGNPSLSSSDSNIDSGNPNRPTDISGNNSPLDSQNKMYPDSANFQNTYKPTDYPNSNQQYRNLGTNSNGENSFSPNLGTDYPYTASGPAINSQLGDQNMMNPNAIYPPNTYNPTDDEKYNPQLNYLDTDFNSGSPSLSSSDSNIDSGNPNRATDISGNNSPLDSQNKVYPDSANFQNTYKPTDYPNSNQQYRNLGTDLNPLIPSSPTSGLFTGPDNRNAGEYLSDIGLPLSSANKPYSSTDYINVRRQNDDSITNLYRDSNLFVNSDSTFRKSTTDRDVQISNDNIAYQGDNDYNQFLSISLTNYEQTDNSFKTPYNGDILLDGAYVSSTTKGAREFSLGQTDYEHDQAMVKSESKLLNTDFLQESSGVSITSDIFNSYSSFNEDARNIESINQKTGYANDQKGNGYIQSVNKKSENNVDDSTKLSYNYNILVTDPSVNTDDVNNVSDDLDKLGHDVTDGVEDTTRDIYGGVKHTAEDAANSVQQGTAGAVNYIGNKADDAYENTKDAANAVQQDASNALNAVGDKSQDIYNASKDVAKDATDAVKQGTADAVNYVGNKAGDAYEDTKDAANAVQQDASNALNDVGEKAENVYDASKDVAIDATDAVKQGTADAVNYVGNKAGDAYEDTKDAANAVQQDASNALNDVGEKAENVYDASKDVVIDATDSVKQGTADAVNFVGNKAGDAYEDTKYAANAVQQDASNALNDVGDKAENVYDASKTAGKQINQAVDDFGNAISSGEDSNNA